MTQLLGKFTVDSGTYFEEVLLIEKGGNHYQIIKNPGMFYLADTHLRVKLFLKKKRRHLKN